MPKRVKMLTSKYHRKDENFFIHPFIHLDPQMHPVCREQIIFRDRLGRGGDSRLCLLQGPQGILTGPNWHNAQLDHVF